MKKQFNLQDWLKDKSQKVETRDGRPARIICTDAKADDGACIIALIPGYGGEEAYQFFPDGRAFSSKSSDEDCADLFLVTPEPEMSEFEKKLSDVFGYAISMSVSDPKKPTDEFVREYAPELLSLARKQLQPEIDAEIEKAYKNSDSIVYENGILYGRAEALKDLPRWREWDNGAAGNSEGHPIALVSGAGGIRFVSVLGVTGEKYIMLDDLKKLPGFKED